MENVSVVTTFVLTAYTEMEDLRYVYFTVFLMLYLLILFVNLVLIVVIYIERGLHEPMYFFMFNLAVNGIYGSTSLMPSLLKNVLSHTYEISLSCCLLQIFCLHTYGVVEFTILAVMGYDRYIAICYPLHYQLIVSPRKVYALIAFSWVYPCLCFGLYFIMTVQRTFCDRFIEKVYCINFALVKLSCLDTSVQSLVGLITIIFMPGPSILMILFSYAQILRICLHASKECKVKAIQTCTPHLLAVINYSIGCLFEVIQSRFNMAHVPYKARLFMSLYFLIFPPVLNSAIYGMSIQAVRVPIFKLFSGKKNRVAQLKVLMN
ncbi:olfactory receptor 142-like [Megalops cyprinoides]|uniref:olfactory receptor 142-like n=1 Tax=Megalops cyprinoides TaxID=118141 RepID=UPI00186411A0|nr:olfactory receptor 142-like [Megalops cyprinoides]